MTRILALVKWTNTPGVRLSVVTQLWLGSESKQKIDCKKRYRSRVKTKLASLELISVFIASIAAMTRMPSAALIDDCLIYAYSELNSNLIQYLVNNFFVFVSQTLIALIASNEMWDQL